MVGKILLGVFILLIVGMLVTGNGANAFAALSTSFNKVFSTTVDNLEA